MRFQFSTAALMLTTAFIAICCVAIGLRIRSNNNTEISYIYMNFFASGYLWVPLMFIAFWIGRGKISWSFVVFFAAMETLALATVWTVMRFLW